MVKFRGKNISNSTVIVPGHAVIGFGLESIDPRKYYSWLLRPFQRGEQERYIEHIEAAVKRASDDESLLIFSGCKSNAHAGPRSEAQSYWLVADHYRWFGRYDVRNRAVTEECARDSFENILFSMCRFRECTGKYPESITMIGWSFKENRFDFHRETLSYPKNRFEYVGVNDPTNIKSAIRGEALALNLFFADPYGKLTSLAEKRKSRNPFNLSIPYETSCQEISGLLRHKGPETYNGPLPWATSS